ncbi:MAG: hypothetical protein E7618_03500 [Ruminococcaceae bacterium]|nr:hypothetical protein [Oscillospiraceae bacterium]
MTQPSKRILSYDILRTVAALAVILIHVAAPYVKHAPVSSADFAIGNILDGIARFGVPFFLFLSGALLLDESKPLTAKALRKKGLTLGLLLVVWSAFYAVVYQVGYPLLMHQDISLRSLVLAFLGGHYHLWYLFMLLGLYLITPFLRLFVKKENARYILGFLLLSLLLCYAVPLLDIVAAPLLGEGRVAAFFGKFELSFLGGYTACYLAGWYLTAVGLTKKQTKALYLLGAIGLAVTLIGNRLLSTDAIKAYPILYADNSANVFLYSAALFLLLHTLFARTTRGAACWQPLSGLTLGVYLIHIVLLDALTFAAERLLPPLPALVEIPLLWLFTAALSFGAVFLLSKIPFLRKLVRA